MRSNEVYLLPIYLLDGWEPVVRHTHLAEAGVEEEA